MMKSNIITVTNEIVNPIDEMIFHVVYRRDILASLGSAVGRMLCLPLLLLSQYATNFPSTTWRRYCPLNF